MLSCNSRSNFECLGTFQWKPAIYCLAIGQDRETFVSSHYDGTIKVGHLVTGELI
jgi:hypothetical protein